MIRIASQLHLFSFFFISFFSDLELEIGDENEHKVGQIPNNKNQTEKKKTSPTVAAGEAWQKSFKVLNQNGVLSATYLQIQP